MPLDDRSVYLISYIGFTNLAMIRPSKQGQRLEERILYIPIGEARGQVHKKYNLQEYYFLTVPFITSYSDLAIGGV